MKFTSIFAVTAPSAVVTFAATITLFGVPSPTTTPLPWIYILPSAAPTLHAIGTGADGMTTYVEEYGFSAVVQLNPIQTGSDGVFNPSTTFWTSTSTETITTGPTIISKTFAEDATHNIFHYESKSIGEDDECVFDGTSMTCVLKNWQGSDTLAQTLSGPAVTIHTTIAAETKDNGAVPGSRYVKESCIAWGVFAIGVLSAWVLLL